MFNPKALDSILNGAGDELAADARYVLARCGNNAPKIERALMSSVGNVAFWHATKDMRREALHETIGCALALLALDEHRRGERVIERETEAMEQRRAQEVR